MTAKPRTYQANGNSGEIVGAASKCVVFVNGKNSGTVFDGRSFSSIRAARLAFVAWAKRHPVS
jgi:hypothetical protein